MGAYYTNTQIQDTAKNLYLALHSQKVNYPKYSELPVYEQLAYCEGAKWHLAEVDRILLAHNITPFSHSVPSPGEEERREPPAGDPDVDGDDKVERDQEFYDNNDRHLEER